MDEKKKRLTEEQVKALLNAGCHKEWFLMKKTQDYNKLALFLKINGVDSIELGNKAYTYEVDLKDETIAGAFIVTEKPWKNGTRWYIAAMTVAPDYRGHKIGDIMYQKIRKLVQADGGREVFVSVADGVQAPDDMDGVKDAKAFWKVMGLNVADGTAEDYGGTQLFSQEI